ncbi:hypothetical protein [Candidatus Weimeria sp. HCP3S3_B5]|jgi:hypothetical protein|uniref:hypothetical protein n=1 Tax=Candidatus Weimeria sp. HCP3S3_B5 TaxID=3438871 RepID=UPI002A9BC24E|nr:hypothetical protein [Lachnospiraceae bacterium]MDY6353050.1 hypothetical protein [Lachnospiraceae bacterium]
MDTDRSRRIYVTVESVFDQTGYMQPISITWDGRRLPVEVRDFCPAASGAGSSRGDCYTIVIGGHEKHLFFERAGSLYPSRVGRWFVEVTG